MRATFDGASIDDVLSCEELLKILGGASQLTQNSQGKDTIAKKLQELAQTLSSPVKKSSDCWLEEADILLNQVEHHHHSNNDNNNNTKWVDEAMCFEIPTLSSSSSTENSPKHD